MDTEEFLIKAEEIAMQYPDDELSIYFLESCKGEIHDETEAMALASRVIMKHCA